MLLYPGLRKLISSKIQQLFNSASFDAPLTHSLALTRGTGSATLTRATTKTFSDHEGVLRTAPAGCAAFTGARFVRNLVAGSSEDLTNGSWGSLSAGTGSAATATSGFTDPEGGTGAWRIQANRGAGDTAGDYSIYRNTPSVGGNLRHVWVKSNTGASQTFTLWAAGSGVSLKTATTEWTQVSEKVSTINPVFDISNYGPDLGTRELDILIWHPQFEDITGRADQTTPSEYVSVGVESAPYYHGAGVDGVKCFNTDLSGNPLPTAYTYDAVSLNGVAGTYVSTPDSVANSITGDIDIRVKVAPTAWGSLQVLVSKRAGAGQASYRFYLNGSGGCTVETSTDGTTLSTAASSALGLTDGIASWVRVTRLADGSAAFYKSSDGTTWTAIGTGSTIAGALFNSTSIVEIGSTLTGATQPFSGKIYRAQVYNGIDGTLAVDFDASRYAGGTTLTGSTGETWTLQGNAVIHPTNNPMLGYLAEGARTNLCLQSNAFTTAPWVNNAVLTVAQDAIGPDGATSGWTLTQTAGLLRYLTQQVGALTAANYTLSFFVKKTTGAQATYPVFNLYAAVPAKICAVTVDTTNGVATVWTSWTGLTVVTSSATCVSHNSNYWRVSLTGLLTADSWRVTLLPAGATSATQATGEPLNTTAGSAVFYGAQVELGSFASSYIATTTVAVTRNADVLTYSSAGNILGTVGAAYAEVAYTPSGVINRYIIDASAPSGNRPVLWDASGANLDLYDGTGVRVLKALTVSPNGTKVASTWGGTSTQGAVSGVAGTAQGFDGDLNVGTSIGFGGTASAELYGTIRNVRIWQRALSSSELQAITS